MPHSVHVAAHPSGFEGAALSPYGHLVLERCELNA
jgi:hypothetical protein